MSYEAKYRKPAGLGHWRACVCFPFYFGVCVCVRRLRPLRALLLLWISMWGCYHSGSCIINNWGLLNWFPPSALEQATYIIAVAPSGKKEQEEEEEEEETSPSFSSATGCIRPFWYLIWGWMSEMAKGRGGEKEGGRKVVGRIGWRSSLAEEGWMCQRPRPVRNRLTFDQSKSD